MQDIIFLHVCIIISSENKQRHTHKHEKPLSSLTRSKKKNGTELIMCAGECMMRVLSQRLTVLEGHAHTRTHTHTQE